MENTFDNLAENNSTIARQRVMADSKLLIRDAELLLKATAHDVSDKAKEVRAGVTTALERAKTICLELEEQAANSAKAAARKTDLVVREHPYECLGVAFGAGLLIGVLAMGCNRPTQE